MGRPTLQSVAQAAGVSPATVSLVLRDKPHAIPAATVARVRDEAERQGYRPNRAAQAMRTGRSGLVLLALRMVADPWSLSVADAVAEAAERDGRTALVQGRGDWYDTVLRIQPDVAYLDSPDPGPVTAARLAELVDRGQRLVVFSDELEPAGFDVVRSPAAPGTALVLEHLLAQTPDVAYLLPCADPGRADASAGVSAPQAARHRPYLDAVAAGLLADRTTFYDGSRAGAFEAALRLLADPPRVPAGPARPAAVLANTDYAALAAVAAAQYLGLCVPDDVLVAGLGNTPEAAAAAPPLTTAGPDDFFARQADLVLAAAGAPPGEGHAHAFAWRLHPRRSTQPREGAGTPPGDVVRPGPSAGPTAYPAPHHPAQHRTRERNHP